MVKLWTTTPAGPKHMAELAIRIRDKEGHNAMLQGEHEVVVVCPDGWGWSVRELESKDHRMVRLAGVSILDASSWVSAEASMNPDFHVCRRRHFKLDPTKFSAAFSDWYWDDARSLKVWDIDPAEFAGYFRTRVPLPRRDVIGAAPVAEF